MFNLILLFVSSICPIFALIQEIARFQEVTGFVDQNTLLLLDIDNTLMRPVQTLGNDTWFEYRLKKNKESGVQDPLEKTIAEWEAIRHLTQMELVEAEIPGVIRHLQGQGVSLMGLTVQGLALATRTVLQLGDLGVDLSLTSIGSVDHCSFVRGHTILHRKGILFTSGKSKGESFFQFSSDLGVLPKKIVLVDDKLSNLKSVEKEAEERGVEFVGLRYSACDEQIANFSPLIAEHQFENSTFSHIVSDKEAQAVLQ
jgi:hypothetical protein